MQMTGCKSSTYCIYVSDLNGTKKEKISENLFQSSAAQFQANFGGRSPSGRQERKFAREGRKTPREKLKEYFEGYEEKICNKFDTWREIVKEQGNGPKSLSSRRASGNRLCNTKICKKNVRENSRKFIEDMRNWCLKFERHM